uniref:ACB domain-containing protein n=1 Tax=Trichuris muris TaxID=70415 RepID=A0A5S6QS75_TRIMR
MSKAPSIGQAEGQHDDVSALEYSVCPSLFPLPPCVDFIEQSSVHLFYSHLRGLVAAGGLSMNLDIAINLKGLELQMQYDDFKLKKLCIERIGCIWPPPVSLTGGSKAVSSHCWLKRSYGAWLERSGLKGWQTEREYLKIVEKLPSFYTGSEETR